MMNPRAEGVRDLDLARTPPALTELQKTDIAFCGRKAEMGLRGALHADEDAALTQDRRYRAVARESRQDALEYSVQAFHIAKGS